jgi:hypothetical protein
MRSDCRLNIRREVRVNRPDGLSWHQSDAFRNSAAHRLRRSDHCHRFGVSFDDDFASGFHVTQYGRYVPGQIAFR